MSPMARMKLQFIRDIKGVMHLVKVYNLAP